MKAKQVGATVVVGWRRDGNVDGTSMVVAESPSLVLVN
jgi:hypothetical protein